MNLKDKISRLKKKGFTLIELIVVIAVLGILVLMAAPKFLGYTAEAKMKQIQNDIKAHEVQASVELINNPNAESTWTALTSDELAEINASNKVLNKKGKSVTTSIGEYSYVLDLDEVNSKLKGKFIWTEKDEVVYYDKNLGKLPEVGEGDGSGDGGSEQLPEFTPENHFDFVDDSSGYEVEGKGKGYYKYTGTGEEIVNIPHEIDGHKMTSYYKMFNGVGSDVKKVVSTNTEVTDMSEMFYESQATSLDLRSLDTSKVTNMYAMFSASKATSLDLSNFNTKSVKDMTYMFRGSQAGSLDLSKFNTSSVESMSGMFYKSQAKSITFGDNFNTSIVEYMSDMFAYSQATSLDLSKFNTSNVIDMAAMFDASQAGSITFGENFNTSNVTNMYSMFSGSQATSLDLSSFDTRNVTNMTEMFMDSQATTGYAKTEEDAIRFNEETTDIPSTLTFTTK